MKYSEEEERKQIVNDKIIIVQCLLMLIIIMFFNKIQYMHKKVINFAKHLNITWFLM